ncbi:hypothetical protein [Curtobacterium herbarum]|nr:hypothetical protein [Curtobacterium herbarum]MBM7474568.1 putative ABC-type ATPase [Curtobacterium herbarum]MCS6545949.1 hypothetical protein [Curtobacterium herbarum]
MSDADFDAAIARFNARAVADGGHELNGGQLKLAHRFANGGHRIAVLFPV